MSFCEEIIWDVPTSWPLHYDVGDFLDEDPTNWIIVMVWLLDYKGAKFLRLV